MPSSLRILAISGSLRRQSFNTSLLTATVELSPANMTVTLFPLNDLPVFDPDLFDAEGMPAAAERFREAIVAADGILIAAPEYNHSLTAPLKNAIDWSSRKPSSFAGKPIGIMSAASSPLGGARVQYSLRLILQPLDAHVMPMPELFVGKAGTKIGADGRLSDEETRSSLSAFLATFEGYVKRFATT
jgi:chromate reductase